MSSTVGRLSGKVAIITGASTGTGPVMARLFVQEGARVLLAARREELVLQAARDAGKGAVGMRADVTREEDVSAMVGRAMKEFGQVDILLNNAAAPGVDKYVWEQTLENWNATIAIDLTAAMLCTREVLKRSMLERKSGSIVNFSSTAGWSGIPRKTHYCSAKAALRALTKTVALEGRALWHPLQLPGAGRHRHRALAKLRQAHGRRAGDRLRDLAGEKPAGRGASHDLPARGYRQPRPVPGQR